MGLEGKVGSMLTADREAEACPPSLPGSLLSHRDRPLLGAHLDDRGTAFGAYVTTTDRCAVRLYRPDGAPVATFPMQLMVTDEGDERGGYFQSTCRRSEKVRCTSSFSTAAWKFRIPTRAFFPKA
jgi:hypothetical protein